MRRSVGGYGQTVARMSLSRRIRSSSPSTVTSVPEYLPYSTRSPFLTSGLIRSPLSATLPGPTATTFPSCGFSLAVSGMMMPPFFCSFSSRGFTTTRSASGFSFTVMSDFLLIEFENGSSVARDTAGTHCRRVLTTYCLGPPPSTLSGIAYVTMTGNGGSEGDCKQRLGQCAALPLWQDPAADAPIGQAV